MKLPEKFKDLPWAKINWFLHGFWALLILYLLNAKGGVQDSNALAASVTILQAVLVVALVGGFWIIRPEVKEAATQTAEEIAERLAAPAARRAALEWIEAQGERRAVDNQSLVDALGEEDENGT
ncbi:hypothetical protein [Pseudoroseicyclus aestuarii]|uniref:hypothetical protein n=1 Tax=Pseudoroseicyclus aestuarii TaxID=1795041 RepID=UPI0011B7E38A|nr:hypothetical protein [Pseudoroseicyclus aestuarii]